MSRAARAVALRAVVLALGAAGLVPISWASTTLTAVAGPTYVPGGSLSTSQTWGPDGSPYVLKQRVWVGSGKTLTILPGTVVKFVPNDETGELFDPGIEITGGRLFAEGTETEPIVFTSIHDDAAGGDSDGAGVAPSAGDWGKLEFDPGDSAQALAMPPSVLSFVSVRYGAGGDAGFYGPVEVHRYGRVRIHRSEFERNLGCGVYVAELTNGVGMAEVTNSLFRGYPDPSTGERRGCGVLAMDGIYVGNHFENTLKTAVSFYTPDDVDFYSNWVQRPVYFSWVDYPDTPEAGRLAVDLRNNAFLAFVEGAHPDEAHNWWGRPLEDPPTGCADFDSLEIPEVYFGQIEGKPLPCSEEEGYYITGYKTKVLPALSAAPPKPQAGINTDPEAFQGIPTSQTFGSGCDPCATNPTVSRGKPVNTATGNESIAVVDTALPSAGETFQLLRAYNSLDDAVGVMGPGWRHVYESRLVFGAGGRVTYVGGDGQRAGFAERDTGGYTADAGVLAELQRTASGFTVEQPDHTSLTFDVSGRLIGVVDEVGVGVSLTYNGDQLTTVTDAAGRNVRFSYADGLLTRVELPDGRWVGYGYTAGRLSSVRDIRGFTTRYEYNPNGWLDRIIDAKDRVVVDNDYDPDSGRVIQQVSPTGAVTAFAWNEATGTATTTAPGGGRWVDRYVGNVLVESVDPLGHVTSYGYDADLNLIAVTDPRGNATTMTYDERGNLLSRTAPPPLSYTETWTYDAADHVTSYTNPRGHTTRLDYLASGLLQSVTYPTVPATTTGYAYNTSGQISAITSPRGKTTAFGYDLFGNLATITTPLGNTTSFGYDDRGFPVWARDPRGTLPGLTQAQRSIPRTSVTTRRAR